MLAPGTLINLGPIVEILHGLRPQAVELAPAPPSAGHKTRSPQDFQVLGDSRKGEVEPVDQLLHGALPGREEVQNPAPIRIDNRIEHLLARLEHGITIL
jgi:hypothetical protein